MARFLAAAHFCRITPVGRRLMVASIVAVSDSRTLDQKNFLDKLVVLGSVAAAADPVRPARQSFIAVDAAISLLATGPGKVEEGD